MSLETEVEFLRAGLKDAIERLEQLERSIGLSVPPPTPSASLGSAKFVWGMPPGWTETQEGTIPVHSHSVNDPGFQHGELPISLPTAAVEGNAAFQQAMQSNYVQGSLSPPLRAYNLSEDDARRLGLPASDTFHSALGGPIDWSSLKTQK